MSNSMFLMEFPVHIFCTLRSCKPKIHRHLRDFETFLYWTPTTLRRRAGPGPEDALGDGFRPKNSGEDVY